jgi:hypothetical protein
MTDIANLVALAVEEHHVWVRSRGTAWSPADAADDAADEEPLHWSSPDQLSIILDDARACAPWRRQLGVA